LPTLSRPASTGGFTDCLLQQGAKKVYAIDVGYGQLAWKLRQDQRVEVLERCNFRHLEKNQLEVEVPLVVTDVSFISLRLIVPGVKKFLEKNGEFIALVKPQFEAPISITSLPAGSILNTFKAFSSL